MKFSHNILRIGSALLLFFLGIGLFFVTVPREFIDLPPTEGASFIIPLESTKIYTQTFQSFRSPINQIGIYFHTLQKNIPQAPISVSILQNGEKVRQEGVSSIFLNDTSATNVVLHPPLEHTPGDDISFQIQIPKELNRTVGLQLREQDESFPAESISFFVNGEKQKNPVGYHVYQMYRPSLSIQLGVVSILAAVFLVTFPYLLQEKKILMLYVVVVPLLYQVPFFTQKNYSVTLYIIQVGVLFLAYFLFRYLKYAPIPSIFGANILAFTTYFPLHLIHHSYAFTYLPFRDIFIDPNQIVPTHTAGSYIGIPAGIIACLGIFLIRKHILQGIYLFVAAILTVGIVYEPFYTNLLHYTFINPSHFVIVSTGAFALLAAHALNWLYHYLGSRDRLTQGLMVSIMGISLLDLLYVGAITLESFQIFS